MTLADTKTFMTPTTIETAEDSADSLDRLVRPIAALCCAPKSVYHELPGVECYDRNRDARTFGGGMPVIAHPPCRLWSAFCSHQAKSDDPEAERALGVFCVEQVRRCGGVLEQPAHSRLWDKCGLPRPSTNWYYNSPEVGFSIEVSQFWWGDAREKSTWLWFYGISAAELPTMPLRLKPDGGDRRIWQLMSSKNQRERTPRQFAEWLVEAARGSIWPNMPS